MHLRHTVSRNSGKHYYFAVGNRRITQDIYLRLHEVLARIDNTPTKSAHSHGDKLSLDWHYNTHRNATDA